MYSLNRVQLIGHLTQAPEIRQTPTGQSVGDLNIMTRSTFINAKGEMQASTSFHTVTVWRGLADIAGRFCKKGSQVFIAGRSQTDEWQDPQGQKRFKTRVTADELIMLDPKMAMAPLPAGSKVSGGLNQAEVIGNVTRDPEIRQIPSGESVATFGVATNFTWKDRSGADQEKTEFHNIVAWGELGRALADGVKKGRKVYVNGRMQTRSWETPDGQKKYATEIIADKVLALQTQDSELGAPMAGATTSVTFSEPEMKEMPAISYESEIKPEDLPF
jgi:single-strand DNA-binding protein